MKHRLFFLCLIIFAHPWGPWVSDVWGQEGVHPDSRAVIRVRGEATITVEPNLAELNVGVETEGPTAKVAAQRNAERQEAVLKTLRELLGHDADIKTIGYSINPVYHHPRDGKRSITGYKVANTIRIRTEDLTRVGDIIDRAYQAGANTTRGLHFMLKDDTAVQLEALGLASQEARTKAKAMASALGIKIKRIIRAEETSPRARPLTSRFAMAAKTGARTPVEPGTLEVHASVTLTVEVNE